MKNTIELIPFWNFQSKKLNLTMFLNADDNFKSILLSKTIRILVYKQMYQTCVCFILQWLVTIWL